jgi:hypothetical protein
MPSLSLSTASFFMTPRSGFSSAFANPPAIDGDGVVLPPASITAGASAGGGAGDGMFPPAAPDPAGG